MTLLIRDFSPADAVVAAACYQAGRPHLVMTPEVVAWLVATVSKDEHYRVLLAEWDGVVVGAARCGLAVHTSTPGQANTNVSVLPEYRGKGVGGALLRAAEAHVRSAGATHAHAWADDDPAALAFAARHGYQQGRAAHFARLDLTGELPAVPALPEGVRIGTAADYLADPHPLYVIDAEASGDEPGDLPMDDLGYQEWHDLIWSRPDQHRELTTVVVVDDVPAAFCAVQTDGAARYHSAFTATRSAYRGRGLAKLAKAASLHRARAAGFTEAYTNNDGDNAPMLAINDWFGYRRCASEWKVVKEL